MLYLRLARLVVHMLYGMLVCAVIFPWIGTERRNGHIRRWSRQLLKMCNVTVDMAPGSSEPLVHAMIVANHVSWLDIFVIDALYPCPEEIAYRKGYIDAAQLAKLAEPLKKNNYGQYLLQILEDKVIPR